jgi:hypothetical protein
VRLFRMARPLRTMVEHDGHGCLRHPLLTNPIARPQQSARRPIVSG